ncbi:MAG: hypothetical protein ACFFD4_33045 [Candidatus Odinarchaeota archaeon]
MSELSSLIQKKEKNRQVYSPKIMKRPAAVQTKGELLFRLLEDRGEQGMTRSEIVKISGIAWTTVYDTLLKLECRGKVHRHSQKACKGRPKVYWRVNSY